MSLRFPRWFRKKKVPVAPERISISSKQEFEKYVAKWKKLNNVPSYSNNIELHHLNFENVCLEDIIGATYIISDCSGVLWMCNSNLALLRIKDSPSISIKLEASRLGTVDIFNCGMAALPSYLQLLSSYVELLQVSRCPNFGVITADGTFVRSLHIRESEVLFPNTVDINLKDSIVDTMSVSLGELHGNVDIDLDPKCLVRLFRLRHRGELRCLRDSEFGLNLAEEECSGIPAKARILKFSETMFLPEVEVPSEHVPFIEHGAFTYNVEIRSDANRRYRSFGIPRTLFVDEVRILSVRGRLKSKAKFPALMIGETLKANDYDFSYKNLENREYLTRSTPPPINKAITIYYGRKSVIELEPTSKEATS